MSVVIPLSLRPLRGAAYIYSFQWTCAALPVEFSMDLCGSSAEEFPLWSYEGMHGVSNLEVLSTQRSVGLYALHQLQESRETARAYD